MATQIKNLEGGVVSNLTSDLALVSGTKYNIQTINLLPTYIVAAAVEPTLPAGGHVIWGYTTWVVEQGTENLYAWGGSGHTRIAVTEAS